MGNNNAKSRCLNAILRDVKASNFKDVYDTIRNSFFKGVCLCPNDPRPSSKELLTKKENGIFHALECAFWANKAAHVLDKTSPGLSEEAYVVKTALLNYVLQELTSNPEKYSDILPSWGLRKDFEGKEALVFDATQQLVFHSHKLNLTGIKDKIPEYKHSFVGSKNTFSDGRSSKNRHDRLVSEKRYSDLVKLGKDGDFFNTYKGVEIQPLYCTCKKDGKLKILPYTAAVSHKLQIETIFGGAIKGSFAYFIAVPQNTPPGEIEQPICIKRQSVKTLELSQDKPSAARQPKPTMEFRLEDKNHLGYQPPGSNIFFVGLESNKRGPLFTFSNAFFGEDNTRRIESSAPCPIMSALKKVQEAQMGAEGKVEHATH